MEHGDVTYHSDWIFELSLEITPVYSCDLPFMEHSDVIYHSDQIFQLSLEITLV